MEKHKILIDSCVWIALYDPNDRQHKKAIDLFTKIKSKNNIYVMHYLALIETLTILKYKKIDIKVINKIRNIIFKSIDIEIVNNVSLNLSKKMWGKFELNNKLGLVDVILLDYCLTNKCRMITFDKELNGIWMKTK
jgi:predicted nucleic acid-binding protein